MMGYSPKHNKKKPLPSALQTIRSISRGYIIPKHYKGTAIGVPKALCMLIAALVCANVLMYSSYFNTITPYALMSEDEVICYVNNKEDAKKAIEEACNKVAPEKKVIRSESNIRIRKASLGKKKNVPDAPSDVIVEKATEENSTVKLDISVIEKITADNTEPVDTVGYISVADGIITEEEPIVETENAEAEKLTETEDTTQEKISTEEASLE